MSGYGQGGGGAADRLRVVDAHHHLWSLATPGHEWPTAAEAAIHRDFAMADLDREAAGIDLVATVIVQSQPTDADTEWLLTLATDETRVAAVVGWADLAAPDAVARIKALAHDPKLRGLRPMLQAIEDTDWLMQDELAPAIGAMLDADLRLDALIQPRHLPMLTRFARRWPGMRIVIDHAAKPGASAGEMDPWRDDIARLADLGVYCKFSGLRTEQSIGQPAGALAPYVHHLVDRFGERLMWGSDWPVVLLSGDGWRQWLEDSVLLADAAGADLAQLFAGAAIDFYDIEKAR